MKSLARYFLLTLVFIMLAVTVSGCRLGSRLNDSSQSPVRVTESPSIASTISPTLKDLDNIATQLEQENPVEDPLPELQELP